VHKCQPVAESEACHSGSKELNQYKKTMTNVEQEHDSVVICMENRDFVFV